MVINKRFELRRRIVALTVGRARTLRLGAAFRFGRLAGAVGWRGFTLWYRKHDGVCHKRGCQVQGFYEVRLNYTFCNRHYQELPLCY